MISAVMEIKEKRVLNEPVRFEEIAIFYNELLSNVHLFRRHVYHCVIKSTLVSHVRAGSRQWTGQEYQLGIGGLC